MDSQENDHNQWVSEKCSVVFVFVDVVVCVAFVDFVVQQTDLHTAAGRLGGERDGF